MSRYTIKLLPLSLLCFPVPVASYTYYQDAESCDIVGDGDIYGIGIRLSIYIQSFTAMIGLLVAKHEELCALRLSINAVVTAVIANFLKDIHNDNFVYLEYWITFGLLEYTVCAFTTMSLCSILIEAIEQTVHEFDLEHGDLMLFLQNFQTAVRMLLKKAGCFSIAWSFLLTSLLFGIQIWIYFPGLHYGNNPKCNAEINFYGYIDMYNPLWVNFLRFLSIVGGITIPVFAIDVLGFFALGIYLEFEKIYWSKATEPPDGPGENIAFPGLTVSDPITGNLTVAFLIKYVRRTLGHLSKSLLFYNTLLFISGIIWTENTLKVNNIDLSAAPISSSGQLIALLIAIFTSVPTLWTIFVRIMEKKRLDRNATTGLREIDTV
ncbi:hypothetical protein J3E69DRAFT_324753 [Trichoderma sp. SZMC 28015]